MPIVFDNHTRGNNDNNGHQLLLQQQQTQQQTQQLQQDTVNTPATADSDSCLAAMTRRTLRSGSLSHHPLKQRVVGLDSIVDAPAAQDQPPLSSGNDAFLSFSSRTETHDSAPAPSSPTKLDHVLLASDKGEQVSLPSDPDHHHLRHYLQHQQQRSMREAHPPHLSVSTQQSQQKQQRGDNTGIDISNNNSNSSTGQQHEEEEKDTSRSYATTKGRRGVDRGTTPSPSPSLPSSPSSLSPLSSLSLSASSSFADNDNNPALLQSSPLLLSSSSSFAHAYFSPLSPPDSATTALPPPSILSPSSGPLIELDSSSCVRRGSNNVGNTSNRGLSVASSENPIPPLEEVEEGKPSSSPRTTAPLCTLSSSLMPASASRSPPHSQDSSWLVSNERRGNESAAPEQARTKRRRSTDSKNNSDDDEDNVRIRLPFPSPSPIEQDYSSSSKETGPQPVESELSLLPAKTELSPSQVMDVQTAAAETIVEAVSSEAKGMSASCDVAKAEGTEAQEEVSTARPSCSYTTMIMEVFHATSKTRLALSDIYTGIMHRYPYYRKAGKIWQSSIRHALSQSKFFGKVDRGPDEPGKGSLWILDPHQSNATPHPARKRKASVDYQHGTAGPAIASDNSKGASAAAASASKLTCVKEESVGGNNNKSQGFHPMVMASIPSPAASDDTEDANTVRRSGRARRPPRTKEANDYVTTLHVRKPSLVVGVSLSTPPASPAPQDHHHAETTLMTPPPPTRKRSSSIRSDKSLSTPIVLRMSHVEIQAKEPTASATATAARKALMDDDDELAAVPGVVTSQRIRRPPQKLAEFVSSEDFKAAPYRKRPSISTTSAFSGDLDRDRTASTATSSRPPSEKRIRKRARPDGGNRRSIVEEPDQEEPMEMIPAQENTALPVPTAPSPGAPAAFISLKDLELSHASTSSRNHDGSGRVRRGTRFTSRHSCRQGSPRRDTYEQRRLAGIQQIVVASLDWYEESDSEADSDTDFGSGSGCSAPRSACNSGVDSGPDYPRGFVREGEEGWMVAEEHELTVGLDLNGGVTQLVDDRCQSEAFETVCITEGTIHSMMEVEETTPFLAPAPCTQPAAQVEWRSQSQQDSQNMVMDQAGLQSVVDEPSSVVDTSLLPILGDMSLFEAPVISEMADAIATDAAAGQQPAWVPNIPAGILKELVVNVEAEKSETGGNAVVPEVVVPMAVELEDSSLEEASVHSEAALMKVDNYMGWLNI